MPAPPPAFSPSLRPAWPLPALGSRAVAAPWQLSLAAATLLITLAGCAVEPAALDPLPFGPCACEDAGGQCPVSVCDLRVELDKETCGDEVGAVEILIGGQLESTIWKPGDRVRTCATIPRGKRVDFVARADTAWRWREEILCPAPDGAAEKAGPTVVRVLHCTTSP